MAVYLVVVIIAGGWEAVDATPEGQAALVIVGGGLFLWWMWKETEFESKQVEERRTRYLRAYREFNDRVPVGSKVIVSIPKDRDSTSTLEGHRSRWASSSCEKCITTTSSTASDDGRVGLDGLNFRIPSRPLARGEKPLSDTIQLDPWV